MAILTQLLGLATLLVSAVSAQSGVWQQCGGVNWSGSKTCVAGAGCVFLNDYYSQCQPGAVVTTTTSSPPITTTTAITTNTPITTTATTTNTPIPTSPVGTGPGSTLLPNWLWVRAVAPPNFHLYLQSTTPRTTTPAILASGTTAGQFNIRSGQLVQLTSSAGQSETLLYGHVTPRVGTEMKLLLTWKSVPDTYGTFTFSGDTLSWSTPGVQRQNNAAFLVCEEKHVYVNLGPYAYQTPAGCADQTIHYYNGATADL